MAWVWIGMGMGWSKALPSLAKPCCGRHAGQAAWLSSKLINLILSYFRDIFFVNGGQQRRLQQHPHPFNSYGLKADNGGGGGASRRGKREQGAQPGAGTRTHKKRHIETVSFTF